MVWVIFSNNQTVRQSFLLPNGQTGSATRYIFIEGRDLPIIFTDEPSQLPQSWAVGINDGVNPHVQLGYEGGGVIQVILQQNNGTLQYTASSPYQSVTNNL